ncbi:MAG: hypothetical protein WC297_01385 [Candidatus Paceibacterota bacterium]|jgi:hypothetical protein
MTREIIPIKNNSLNLDNPEDRLIFYKETLSKITSVFFDPQKMDEIYKGFEEIAELRRKAKTEKEEKALNQRSLKLSQQAAHIKLYPWENLLPLALSGKEDITPVSEMRSSLIDEYCPKTPTELALIETIAIAHYNFIRNTGVLNTHLMTKDETSRTLHFDSLQMKAAKEAAKAVDLAYRQFTNSIMLLKELRQPKLNIHVKTENAYLAKNQQVINVKKSNRKKEKIINAK